MTSANPQIRDEYSPLNALVTQAMRAYGEFGVSTINEETNLLLLDFANEVVTAYNTHPYGPNEQGLDEVKEYTSVNDARPISDQIMRAGLIAHYATQQGSPKANYYVPRYMRLMNTILWHQLSNGSGPIKLRQVDDGTNPSNLQGTVNPITGQIESS